MALQITGSWYLFIHPGWGEEADWDNLPVITFEDGCITLGDGSHPAFTNKKGVLTFSLPIAGAQPDRAFATLAIDRGSEGHLQGWRYLADHPLAAIPDPEKALPGSDRLAPVRLIREDKFAAFRAEQSRYADAQRQISEQFEANGPSSATVH